MKTLPKVSVLIPVLNGLSYPANLLERSLNSVISQPVDWELILVDDGSTDGTRQWLQSFAGNHPRIHYLAHDTTQGQAKALNTALTAASGKYIHQMSVRCWYEGSGLRLLTDALDNNRNAGFAYASLKVHHNGRGVSTTMAAPYNRDKFLRRYRAIMHIYRHEAVTRGCRYVDYVKREGRVLGITDRDMLMQMMLQLDYDGVAIPQVATNYYYDGTGTHVTVKRHDHEITQIYESRWGYPRFG